MLNSGIYKQLCPVLYGAGVIERTGEVCKELGLKKVMLVTDPGIVSVGPVSYTHLAPSRPPTAAAPPTRSMLVRTLL